jgi:hypothetical protein
MSTTSLVVFLVHAVIFVVMVILAVANPSLLQNEDYINMLYIVLGTLVTHGGYTLGKSEK